MEVEIREDVNDEQAGEGDGTIEMKEKKTSEDSHKLHVSPTSSKESKGRAKNTTQPNTLQKPSVNLTGKKATQIAKSHILRGVGLRKPKVQNAMEIVPPSSKQSVDSQSKEKEVEAVAIPVATLPVAETFELKKESTAVNKEYVDTNSGGTSTAAIETKSITKSTGLRKSRKSPIQTRPTDDSIIMETGYSNPDSPAELDHQNSVPPAKTSNAKTTKQKRKQKKAGKKKEVLEMSVEDKVTEQEKTTEKKKTAEKKNIVSSNLTDKTEDTPTKKSEVSSVEKAENVEAEKTLNQAPPAVIATSEEEDNLPLSTNTKEASSSQKQNTPASDIKKKVVLKPKNSHSSKNNPPAKIMKSTAVDDKVSSVEKEENVEAEKTLNQAPPAVIATSEEEDKLPLSTNTTEASSSQKQNTPASDIKKKVVLKRKSSQSSKNNPPAKIMKSTDEATPEHSGPTLPAGWKREVVQRQTGKTAGKFDIYIYSPDGKKLRSRNEVRRYVEAMNYSGVSAEDFEFSVGRDVKVTVKPAEEEKSADQEPKVTAEAAAPAKKDSEEPEGKRASKRQASATGGLIVKLFSQSKKNSKK